MGAEKGIKSRFRQGRHGVEVEVDIGQACHILYDGRRDAKSMKRRADVSIRVDVYHSLCNDYFVMPTSCHVAAGPKGSGPHVVVELVCEDFVTLSRRVRRYCDVMENRRPPS